MTKTKIEDAFSFWKWNEQQRIKFGVKEGLITKKKGKQFLKKINSAEVEEKMRRLLEKEIPKWDF